MADLSHCAYLILGAPRLIAVHIEHILLRRPEQAIGVVIVIQVLDIVIVRPQGLEFLAVAIDMDGVGDTVVLPVVGEIGVSGFKDIDLSAVLTGPKGIVLKIAVRHHPERRPRANDLRHLTAHLKVAVGLRKALVSLCRACLIAAVGFHGGLDTAGVPARAKLPILPIVRGDIEVSVAYAHGIIDPVAALTHALLCIGIAPVLGVEAVPVKVILKRERISGEVQLLGAKPTHLMYIGGAAPHRHAKCQRKRRAGKQLCLDCHVLFPLNQT